MTLKDGELPFAYDLHSLLMEIDNAPLVGDDDDSDYNLDRTIVETKIKQRAGKVVERLSEDNPFTLTRELAPYATDTIAYLLVETEHLDAVSDGDKRLLLDVAIARDISLIEVHDVARYYRPHQPRTETGKLDRLRSIQQKLRARVSPSPLSRRR